MSAGWVILVVLTLARTTMGFQFQLVPALAPLYLDDFALGYAAFGALAGAYLLPGVIAALAGGWLGTRIGDIRTALWGLGLMTVGGLGGAVLASFEGQMAARLVAGTGAVALNVMVTKMAGDWFQGRKDLPAAMGVLVTSWPMGIALAMLFLPAFWATFGSTAALMTAPCLAALGLVLLWTVWRAPDGSAPAAAAIRSARLTVSELWLVGTSGLLWAIYNLAFIALMTWMPQALISAGRSTVSSSALVSFVGWTTLLSITMGGWLASRTSRPDIVPILSLAATGALALGFGALGAGPVSVLYMILLGLAFGPAAGVIMTLPIEATRREVRAMGMGLFLVIYYAFMALGPLGMGALVDLTGNHSAPVTVAGLLFLACIGLWALFRRSQAHLAPRWAITR